jgi:hypothetical protein
MTEAVLFTTTRITTFLGPQTLTNASGFFFEREGRLHLVTSRHVVIDEPSKHFPDRIEIELHVDRNDLTRSARYSVPLYRNSRAVWRQAADSGGDIDVAVLELDRRYLPDPCVFNAFTPAHLQRALDEIGIGSALSVVGFPLGFHDTLHHLPVVRQGAIASSFGVRFQGQGYFLTDARTHRGTSGAPVLMRYGNEQPLPWRLLGVHSAQMDMKNRDGSVDESLALNCAWYADVLLTLTEAPKPKGNRPA